MTDPTPEQFRKKLIAELTYKTRWPRQVALHGGEEGLAVRLGVQEDVLTEAIRLSRLGFRLPDRPGKPGPKPSKLVLFHVHYPVEIMSLANNLALELGRAPTNLLRDLLHAAMQTTSEPSGEPRMRYRKIILRGKLLSGRFADENVRISPALKDVIHCRAIAYGQTAHAYVRCWLLDLVEGRLGYLKMPPIRPSQMFDSVDAYVMPVLTDLPSAEQTP